MKILEDIFKDIFLFAAIFIFTTAVRMMRPVLNLELNKVEMIGTFEQVFLTVCVDPSEAIPGVSIINPIENIS